MVQVDTMTLEQSYFISVQFYHTVQKHFLGTDTNPQMLFLCYSIHSIRHNSRSFTF